MDATVGVVTYNRPDCVPDLLSGLAAQTRSPDEVIVVDDSEGDRTRQAVEEATRGHDWGETPLRYVGREEPGGIPSARNEVVERTSGDVVCFVDDDAIPAERWLESVVDTYERTDGSAVGGPAITATRDREPTVEIRRDPENVNRMTRYGEVGLFADRWIPPAPVETEVLVGANMSFERSALAAIGGFDPGYGGPGSSEELDVVARLRAAGHTVYYHPDALVYHLEAEEGGSRSDVAARTQAYYWEGRNLVRFRARNFPETFWPGIVRLLVSKPYAPAPAWKQVASALVEADPAKLWFLRGYLDGLLYERGARVDHP